MHLNLKHWLAAAVLGLTALTASAQERYEYRYQIYQPDNNGPATPWTPDKIQAVNDGTELVRQSFVMADANGQRYMDNVYVAVPPVLQPNGLWYVVYAFMTPRPNDTPYETRMGDWIGLQSRTATTDPCGAGVHLTKCGKTVEQLRLAGTHLRIGSGERLFNDTQLCIADGSCRARCNMENCDWLNELVPNFVAPYIAKSGGWPGVMNDCWTRTMFQQQNCARIMAAHHIDVDLVKSLSEVGCGGEGDWNAVYEIIKKCSVTTMKNVFPPVVSGWAAMAGAKYYREGVRTICKARRTASALPVDVNPNLKGKTCTL